MPKRLPRSFIPTELSPSSRPFIPFCSGSSAKGWWPATGARFVHLFSATASQADILGQELKTLVERLGTGSVAPLIMQLIDRKRLSRKEAAEIRKLLEKYPQ